MTFPRGFTPTSSPPGTTDGTLGRSQHRLSLRASGWAWPAPFTASAAKVGPGRPSSSLRPRRLCAGPCPLPTCFLGFRHRPRCRPARSSPFPVSSRVGGCARAVLRVRGCRPVLPVFPSLPDTCGGARWIEDGSTPKTGRPRWRVHTSAGWVGCEWISADSASHSVVVVGYDSAHLRPRGAAGAGGRRGAPMGAPGRTRTRGVVGASGQDGRYEGRDRAARKGRLSESRPRCPEGTSSGRRTEAARRTSRLGGRNRRRGVSTGQSPA